MPTTTNTAIAPTTSTPSAVRPLRILYAEDMQALRDLLSIILTREGHVIETVADGSAALERLLRAGPDFDLLITDHEMPRLNGLELVRQIRQGPFAGKIVVFSAELTDALYVGYRAAGVDLILPKPIFPMTLRMMLGMLFTPHDEDGEAMERRLTGA